MQFRLPYPPGLKVNALLISVTLLTLTGILGVRAYAVAKSHLHESRALLDRDVPLQNLLFELESHSTAKKQAVKKWEITRDPAYGKLVVKHRTAVKKSWEEIEQLRPGFLPTAFPRATFVDQQEQLQVAQDALTQERVKNVKHAGEVAAGLLRVILIAGIMCLVVTAWLIALLYRGLVYPLQSLREATTRIREGDLACRLAKTGVTEIRDIAEDFNSMAERLESLEKAKNEFLATISHEIRNPMAALKEGLNLLSSDERRLSPESNKKCLSACLIASKRLEFMLNNLLNLSKTGSGIFVRDFGQRNIVAAIQTAMDEVRPLAEKRLIQIRLTAPENIPLYFHWDGIVQAFVNLLLNAIKYGVEASFIEVTIGTVETPTAGVQIGVTNAGTDISAEELPKVFDRFYRGANSVKQQGMGVGLHVVKKVVEAHHGAVSAHSGGGKTRLQITLPRQVPDGANTLSGGLPVILNTAVTQGGVIQ